MYESFKLDYKDLTLLQMDASLQRVARDYDERMARLNKVAGEEKGCMCTH